MTASEPDFPKETAAESPPQPVDARRPVHEVRMPAMATEFAVLLPFTDGHHLDDALGALALVSEIEQRMSVYQADSDISRLNAADSQPCRLHADVLAVLQDAAVYSQQTGGAFDITAGPLVDAWGFTHRSGRKPTTEEVETALASVGWEDVVVDMDAETARLRRPGMRINLGAIGKGYAIDRVAEVLMAKGIENFLLHGGNSTVLARGAHDPLADPDGGWLIGLQHPSNPRQRLGGIRLCNAAMSTSGPGKQFFHHRGRRFGHVIDPRTGWPAGDLESLTIVTPSAAQSDALATGWFVRGREDALRHADENATPLYCVAATDRQSGVEVLLAGGAELVG